MIGGFFSFFLLSTYPMKLTAKNEDNERSLKQCGSFEAYLTWISVYCWRWRSSIIKQGCVGIYRDLLHVAKIYRPLVVSRVSLFSLDSSSTFVRTELMRFSMSSNCNWRNKNKIDAKSVVGDLLLLIYRPINITNIAWISLNKWWLTSDSSSSTDIRKFKRPVKRVSWASLFFSPGLF